MLLDEVTLTQMHRHVLFNTDAITIFLDIFIMQDEVNSLYEKLPEEERTAEYKEACFVKVMGEDGHGRVRTWGSGVSKPLSEEASKSIRTQIREERCLWVLSDVYSIDSQLYFRWKWNERAEEHMAEIEFSDQELCDPAAAKKAHVIWSVDLHQKFVNAVDQIGLHIHPVA
ncbi:Two-component response regulator ARR14 [Platanthera zijinensis]|uniref:Two-component response regulator ARR14 n=1 Tax=Platanthera zijinensis TaxID=2320716 RepID=A0AAP0B8V5_9ASPA